jgi:hypothetical protein
MILLSIKLTPSSDCVVGIIMLLIGYLLVRGNVRKAAVGRVELRTLFAVCPSSLIVYLFIYLRY